MKKIIIFYLFITNIYVSFGQVENYNLSFEKYEDNNFSSWSFDQSLEIKQDSIFKKHGKYSLLIANTYDNSKILSAKNVIDKTFEGDSIQFEGSIKTQDLKGKVYCFIIVENEKEQLYFDMTNTYSGTNDWQNFKISLPYSKNSSKITINCNLEGKGNVWLDDFKIFINKISIEKHKSILYENNLIDSNFRIDSGLNNQLINRLYIICKIWGYLKYYHPKISTGQYNWDNELFKILPIYKSNNFDSDIETWVNSFGNIELYKKRSVEKYFKQKVDLSWFNNILICDNLKNTLLNIYNCERKEKENNFYASQKGIIKLNTFSNEIKYDSINYKDDGIKLLSLFRYCNIVEYFYPYKYKISKNWDSVVINAIPKIIDSQTKMDYLLSINRVIVQTEDTHSRIVKNSSLEEYYGLNKAAIKVKALDDKLIINSIDYIDSELNLGDEIIAIDSLKVEEIRDKIFDSFLASNSTSSNRDFANAAIRTNADFMTLKLKRENELKTINIPTFPKDKFSNYRIPENTIEEINSDIGYMFVKDISKKEIDSLFLKWNSKKGIIIDLRCYPKENIAYLILPYLFEKPFLFFKSTNTDVLNPGNFLLNDSNIIKEFKKPLYKGKIIALIDENTQSKSEFAVLALKAYNKTVIIGSETSGTDGDCQIIILPDNIEVNMTAQGIYGSKNEETQKSGIIPDIRSYETIQSIKHKKDITLSRAIKEILQD